jgi:flagellar basal-body rod modification protein FlgD
MQMVPANYTLPAIFSSLLPPASGAVAKGANAKAAASTTNTTTANSADGGLDSTFLNLLTKELQNQDPTAPMDSTAMVGQMISLNQLDQLISINQVLTSASSSATSGAVSGGSTAALAGANGAAANALVPQASATSTNQLPFDPNTMLPIGWGNNGAAAASINSSLNPATMGMSGTNNNTNNSTTGGK